MCIDYKEGYKREIWSFIMRNHFRCRRICVSSNDGLTNDEWEQSFPWRMVLVRSMSLFAYKRGFSKMNNNEKRLLRLQGHWCSWHQYNTNETKFKEVSVPILVWSFKWYDLLKHKHETFYDIMWFHDNVLYLCFQRSNEFFRMSKFSEICHFNKIVML